MIKAAIYARVSTDSQSENSIPDQIRECQNYIKKEDWEIYGTYADKAVSGADVAREDYSRLKADAFLGKFDYIVIDDLSRIGRDMPEFTKLYQELTEVGVNIIGVADGIDTSKPSSKIPAYFKGIMNEIFLDDMKAKVVRGLKGQFLRGYSTGGRIYGYKTEPIYDPSGQKDKSGRIKRLGCKIVVDEEATKVVQRIFELRRSGLGYRAIACTLNGENVPPPRADTASGSKYWSAPSIRSITLNKKYIGVWEYNKIRWIKKRIKGQRRCRQNSPSELVSRVSEDLRIVCDELFYAVNSRIKQRPSKGRAGNKKYLLSGLLVCADCGGAMIVHNSRDYSCIVCNNARSKGSTVCSNRHRLPRNAVEQAFLEVLRTSLFRPQIIFSIVDKATVALRKSLSSGKRDRLELCRARVKLQRQIENLLTLVESGDTSRAVKARIEQREQELDRLNVEIERSKISPDKTLKVSVDWVRDKLLNLQTLVFGKSDRLVLFRNELRNLFPGKLSVQACKTKSGTEFQIDGFARPFNLLAASNVQQCIKSPWGRNT